MFREKGKCIDTQKEKSQWKATLKEMASIVVEDLTKSKYKLIFILSYSENALWFQNKRLFMNR